MEESRITCAKFINADITVVICAPERGAVSPNFPHCSHPISNEILAAATDRAGFYASPYGR